MNRHVPGMAPAPIDVEEVMAEYGPCFAAVMHEVERLALRAYTQVLVEQAGGVELAARLAEVDEGTFRRLLRFGGWGSEAEILGDAEQTDHAEEAA